MIESINFGHDLVMASNFLETAKIARSSGSVLCWTSALAEKRISGNVVSTYRDDGLHDPLVGYLQLFALSGRFAGEMSVETFSFFIGYDVLPLPVFSGLGLLLFSGLILPVGNLVLAAAASVASNSSLQCHSGLLSLFNTLSCGFQKSVLLPPSLVRRYAGGEYPPLLSGLASSSESEPK